MTLKIFKPYENKVRDGISFPASGRTKQSFKDETDINQILAKERKTGLITHVNRFQGQYADVTGAVDYQEALNAVADAREAFASVPAGIRAQFENDPGTFLKFVTDPTNAETMYDMGLAVRPAAEPDPASATTAEPLPGPAPAAAEAPAGDPPA